MRVAYLTNYDSSAKSNWSGLGYHMARSLESQGVELIRIDCSIPISLIQRLRRKMVKLFTSKISQPEREEAYLRRMASKAKRLLSRVQYDVLFSPGSLPLSFLRQGKPMVFFTDATYDCLVHLYEKNNSVSPKSLRQGHNAERQAISNASMIFYTSEWAARSAITTYQASSTKVRLLSFGSNLPFDLSYPEVDRLIKRRKGRAEHRFLFVGVDWDRKGADAAIATIERLNTMGIKASITLTGCDVPDSKELPAFATHYPYISKDTEVGINSFQALFSEAHFFILPTVADCTPVVFSEAASFGLPIITTDVGGCRSVVIDGMNGYCVSVSNFCEEASIKISQLCRDEEMYEAFCLQSYYIYRHRLNWNVIGYNAVNAMRELLQRKNGVLSHRIN